METYADIMLCGRDAFTSSWGPPFRNSMCRQRPDTFVHLGVLTIKKCLMLAAISSRRPRHPAQHALSSNLAGVMEQGHSLRACGYDTHPPRCIVSACCACCQLASLCGRELTATCQCTARRLQPSQALVGARLAVLYP